MALDVVSMILANSYTEESLTGSGALKGQDGKDGADGKGAYELAVEKGFEGSDDEWLESLKGVDGKDGTDGKDGADGKDGKDGLDGEQNVIESISVNGSLLEPDENKNVDIAVPTVSAETGNMLETKADGGLYVKDMSAKISAEEKNALIQKEDGLYVPTTAETKVSEIEDNAIEVKDDGIYVKDMSTKISSEENNALTSKEDGLYVPSVSEIKVSQAENNIIETKDDGIYVAPTDLSGLVEKIDGKGLSTNDLTNEMVEKIDNTYTKDETYTCTEIDKKFVDVNVNFYEYVETTEKYGEDILKYPIGNYKIGNYSTIGNFKNTPTKEPGMFSVVCPITNSDASPFEEKSAYRYYKYTVGTGDTYERTLGSLSNGNIYNDTGWKKIIYEKDIHVDDQLSAASENPVQNKAIKTYIDDMGYLYSPSGLKYKLLVADDGSLSTVSVNQINMFTFDTSKVSDSTTVTLQNFTGSDEEYDGTTDWGDGTIDTSLTHTYSADGVYNVKTKYLINKSTTGDSNTRKMLTDCIAINSEISDYSYMFYNCSNLTELSANSWDTTKATSMLGMFSGCSSLDTLEISEWNTNNVSDMEDMFSSCSKLLTLDINDWDVTNVTNMNGMFSASGLTEIDLTGWKTKNVTDMSYMFRNCKSLVSVANDFNTSKVTKTSYMFNNCTSLASVDTNWNTSNVTNMEFMFTSCSALETLDVSGWDTFNVTSMDSMFQKAGIKNLDLSAWDVSKVNNMMYMFTYGTFETININNWNAEVCSNIMYLFGACTKLTTLYAKNVKFPKANTLTSLFYGDALLTSLDLSTWSLPILSAMPSTFGACSGLTNLNLSGWDVTNVVNMTNAFAQCTSLTDLNISGWDMATASTNMTGAFNKTAALTLDSVDMTDCSDATVTKITDAFNARTA